MRWMLTAVVMFLGLAWSTGAQAWGDTAHRTVCEIAVRNLTPAARTEVSRLLRAHPAILSANPLNAEYGWACTYPDHPAVNGPGRRSPEHFAIYARTTLLVTKATGCGDAPQCVVSAIDADYAVLRSPGATDLQRAAALIYLGHWLGDIHQPLHISFADDRGGNQIKSTGQCTYSLHSSWDVCILQNGALPGAAGVEEVRALAARWNDQASDADRAAWLPTEPWQWSAESFALTLRPEMGYCVIVLAVCQYSSSQMAWANGQPERTVRIDREYMNWAMPVIQRRITQAGVRLAHLLNVAFDPAYRGGENRAKQ